MKKKNPLLRQSFIFIANALTQGGPASQASLHSLLCDRDTFPDHCNPHNSVTA